MIEYYIDVYLKVGNECSWEKRWRTTAVEQNLFTERTFCTRRKELAAGIKKEKCTYFPMKKRNIQVSTNLGQENKMWMKVSTTV